MSTDLGLVEKGRIELELYLCIRHKTSMVIPPEIYRHSKRCKCDKFSDLLINIKNQFQFMFVIASL